MRLECTLLVHQIREALGIGADTTVVIGLQDRVAERQAFDRAGLGAIGRTYLKPVADAKWPIDNQGDAGHQVAQRVLRGDADDDGQHTDAGQQGGAKASQRRNEVRIKRQRDEPDENGRQILQEPERRRIQAMLHVTRQDESNGAPQRSGREHGQHAEYHQIEQGSDQGRRIHVGREKPFSGV